MPQPTDADYEDFTGPTFEETIQSKPSYNEPGYGDKPREVDPLTPEQEQFIAKYWRCEIASLASVDRGIGDLVDRLDDLGELNETIVVFGSDNGFFHGEHRYPRGKGDIYREAMEVPLAVRIPPSVLGEQAVDSVGSTVTQLDLTATLLELGGADPCNGSKCRRLDGRSFAPLLRGDSSSWWGKRAVLFELGKSRCRLKVGVRTKRHTYVQRAPECDEGEKDAELYNRIQDPFELKNLARREKKAARRLARLTEDLRRCSGVEGRDPKALGATFCR
jgi:arylsulfatase A-like enzyme